jgi:Ca2+ transporting ATPase
MPRRSASRGPKGSSRSRSRPKTQGIEAVSEFAHTIPVDEVLELCGVDPDAGLSSREAARLLEKFGKNELPKPEGESLLKMFLEQFDDPLVKILLIAAGISLVSSFLEGTMEGLIEFGVIMTILIFNAVVGVWQEKRAEDAIEALQGYNPEKAKVLRDGKVTTMLASEVVPSDIVEVNVGDKVPADSRIIRVYSTTLKVEQAALTGESASVNKSADILCSDISCELQQKTCCLFSGTDLVYGKCRCIVIKTGTNTEIGKIAKSLSETEETSSPLKQKLDDFGDLLTKIITWICVLCWAVNVMSVENIPNMLALVLPFFYASLYAVYAHLVSMLQLGCSKHRCVLCFLGAMACLKPDFLHVRSSRRRGR